MLEVGLLVIAVIAGFASQVIWPLGLLYNAAADFLISGLFGFLGPRRFWRWPVGLCVGQVIAAVPHYASAESRAWLVLAGIPALLLFTVPKLAGAAIGARLRQKLLPR